MPPNCPVCNIAVPRHSSSIGCSICFTLYHSSCLDIPPKSLTLYKKPNSNWICPIHSISMPSTPKLTVDAVKSNNTLTLSDLAKMISTLSSNQDKSFKLINSRIDDLSTHLNKLDSALAECQNKTQRLEDRVKALETQKPALENNYIDFSLAVRNEVLDVQKRSLNVILHGVKESIETVAKERIIHDNNKINELFTLLSINSDVIANISRLGHPSSSNQRPIKLILRNPCDADRILTSFMKVKRESPNAVQNISLVKDRTQAERRHIKEVYVDFKNRSEAGEKDIKVQYFNGIPKIVNIKKN